MRIFTNTIREVGGACGISPGIIEPTAHFAGEVARQMQVYSNPSSSPRSELQSGVQDQSVKGDAGYYKGFSPVIQEGYIKKENPKPTIEKKSIRKLNFAERVVEKVYRRAQDIQNIGKQFFGVDLLKKVQQNSATVGQIVDSIGVPKGVLWAFKKMVTIADRIHTGVEYKNNVPVDSTVIARDKEDDGVLVSRY